MSKTQSQASKNLKSSRVSKHYKQASVIVYFKCSIEKCTVYSGDGEDGGWCALFYLYGVREDFISRMMLSLERLIHQANERENGRRGCVGYFRQNQLCKQRLCFIVFKYTV